MKTIEITKNDVFSSLNKRKVFWEWILIGGIFSLVLSRVMFFLIKANGNFPISVLIFFIGMIFAGVIIPTVNINSMFIWRFSKDPSADEIQQYKQAKFAKLNKEIESNNNEIAELKKRNIEIGKIMIDLE